MRRHACRHVSRHASHMWLRIDKRLRRRGGSNACTCAALYRCQTRPFQRNPKLGPPPPPPPKNHPHHHHQASSAGSNWWTGCLRSSQQPLRTGLGPAAAAHLYRDVAVMCADMTHGGLGYRDRSIRRRLARGAEARRAEKLVLVTSKLQRHTLSLYWVSLW